VGATVRPPRADEAAAVADLIVTCDIADRGEPDWSLEDTRSDWSRLGFELERDARVVVAPDGRLIAYTDVHGRPNATQIAPNSVVHPDFRSGALDLALIELAESLAAQHAPHAGQAPLPVQWIMETNRGHLLTGRGYAPTRWLWQMRLELTETPPPPTWPAGYEARVMQEADERETYELVERAFTRPDRAPSAYGEWRRYMIEREDFDRSLFFIAVHRGEIVGTSLCTHYANINEGWVRQLSVKEGHRGQGLGRALLLHSFGVFHSRGARRAGLGVDANNPSATKLYLAAGMRAIHEYAQYQKTA
jgi:GNAT superfamily N-acetyltransferase